MVGTEQGRVMVTRAYEVDAASMCDVLGDVSGVQGVSLEFDSRGNGVLRIRLRPDVDEDAVVGAAVAQLHRQFGVGLEGGRMRLTGPSGRTVVAVVEPVDRERSTWTSWSDGPALSGLDSVSEPDAWVPYLRSWDRPVRPVPEQAVRQPSPRDPEPEALPELEAVPEPAPAVPVEEPWAPRFVLGEPLMHGSATHARHLPAARQAALSSSEIDTPEAEVATPEKEVEDLVPDVASLSPEVYELALKVAELALEAGGTAPDVVAPVAEQRAPAAVNFLRELDESVAELDMAEAQDEIPDVATPDVAEAETALAAGDPALDDQPADSGLEAAPALQRAVEDSDEIGSSDDVDALGEVEPALEIDEPLTDVTGFDEDVENEPDDEIEPDVVPAPADVVEPPAAVATSTGAGRLVLDRVEVATGRMELWATVHLRAGDALYTGTASATATGSGANRAVVGATARAAESAMGGSVRLDVEAVDMLGIGSDRVGVVVVTLLSERGVDRVTGAALVRGDARETLVRATLDALNRRTERAHQGHI
jgi:hypothetical protein